MPTALATAGATIFGSAASKAINKPDDSAQRAQMKANERNQAFIEEQAAKAERSGTSLYDLSQQNLLAGNAAAMGAYKDAFNPQLQSMGQGNYNAQQQISQGLPQIQNALMGLPVDYSAFSPMQQAAPDMSWMDRYKISTIAPGTQQDDVLNSVNRSLALMGLPTMNKGVQFGSASQALALSPQEIQAQQQAEADAAAQAKVDNMMNKFRGWA